MSAELQWQLIRNNSAFLVRRNGVDFSREPTNLAGLHTYKYCGLHQPSIKMQPTAEGVLVTRPRKNVASTKVASVMAKPSIIKRTASPKVRAARIARDMQSTGFRLDLIPTAQARLQALLASAQPRKKYVKKMRANKLAKLGKTQQ